MQIARSMRFRIELVVKRTFESPIGFCEPSPLQIWPGQPPRRRHATVKWWTSNTPYKDARQVLFFEFLVRLRAKVIEMRAGNPLFLFAPISKFNYARAQI